MKIIGLTGLEGSGKDTVADFLVEAHGFHKVSFASPMKKALNIMFNWEMEQWDDREWKERTLKELGKSPRQLAQTLGTEWGRELVNPRLWLLVAAKEIKRHQKVVISDVRYDEEAEYVRAIGGRIFMIDRPGTVKLNHKSSGELSPEYVDVQVNNSASIAQLKKQVNIALMFGGIK